MKPAIVNFLRALIFLLITAFNRIGCLLGVHEYLDWSTGKVGQKTTHHQTCCHCNKHRIIKQPSWEANHA